MFDSYGEGFAEHAREVGTIDLFEGFTNFEETLTNSDYTCLSMASFMSGKYFEPAKDVFLYMA